MHQRHDGFHTVFPAAGDDFAIMLDLLIVKASLLRFDARPLNGKTVGVQSGLGQELDIFFVAIIVIAGEAAGFGEAGMGQMLLRPVVAVNVVALHLVGGGRRADQKSLRKSHAFVLLMPI